MVVEAATANRAFAKGGGCLTVWQPLSTGPRASTRPMSRCFYVRL
jgi:hypothetical protein